MRQTTHDGTQLRDILRAAIEEGEYPPCTALPSEAELAERYGMQESVRNALESLTNEGLLKRGSAKNYYVQSRKMERDLDKLQGFTQTMLDKNITPSFKIISRKIRNAGMKYSFMFGIKSDDPVFYIKRLCYADAEPVSLEEIFIPRYVVPKLDGIDMNVFSIYEVYQMYGIKTERAIETLDIVHLPQNDANILGIDPALPVMLFQSRTIDDQGRVIEFNRNHARGDKCNFSVRFQK